MNQRMNVLRGIRGGLGRPSGEMPKLKRRFLPIQVVYIRSVLSGCL